MEPFKKPFCPVCEQPCELVKITGNNFDLVYWQCDCLAEIEEEGIEPDIHYYIEEED